MASLLAGVGQLSQLAELCYRPTPTARLTTASDRIDDRRYPVPHQQHRTL